MLGFIQYLHQGMCIPVHALSITWTSLPHCYRTWNQCPVAGHTKAGFSHSLWPTGGFLLLIPPQPSHPHPQTSPALHPARFCSAASPPLLSTYWKLSRSPDYIKPAHLFHSQAPTPPDPGTETIAHGCRIQVGLVWIGSTQFRIYLLRIFVC